MPLIHRNDFLNVFMTSKKQFKRCHITFLEDTISIGVNKKVGMCVYV